MFQLLKSFRLVLILCHFILFRISMRVVSLSGHGKIHHWHLYGNWFLLLFNWLCFGNLVGVSLSFFIFLFFFLCVTIPPSVVTAITLFVVRKISWVVGLYGRYTLHVFDQNSLCRNVEYQNARVCACVYGVKNGLKIEQITVFFFLLQVNEQKQNNWIHQNLVQPE